MKKGIIAFIATFLIGFLAANTFKFDYNLINYCKVNKIEIYDSFIRLYCGNKYLDIFISKTSDILYKSWFI